MKSGILVIITILCFSSSIARSTSGKRSFYPPIIITLPVLSVTPIYEEDEDILARLVFSECGHEPFMGKLAVAQVVLNRMKKKNKTLREIIYQKGQFDGVNTKYFEMNPNKESKLAASMILKGLKVIPDNVLYYANECVSTDTKWIKKISPFVWKRINNHSFYKNPDNDNSKIDNKPGRCKAPNS